MEGLPMEMSANALTANSSLAFNGGANYREAQAAGEGQVHRCTGSP